jgi:2-oxoisovalerate dehydrogenase E1 component
MVIRNPVLIVEHHSLYPEEGLVPTDDLSYFVRPDRARTVADGEDVTLVAYQAMTHLAMSVAEDLGADGISVEVIDLRALDYASLDFETIEQSVRKTGALVTLEESPMSRCIGPKIGHRVQGDCFEWLDCPVKCIGAADVPMPVSKVLETAVLPNREQVKHTVRDCARRQI